MMKVDVGWFVEDLIAPLSYIFQSMMGVSPCQIRLFQEHTCTWNYHCKTLTLIVIAKRYASKIMIYPQINVMFLEVK